MATIVCGQTVNSKRLSASLARHLERNVKGQDSLDVLMRFVDDTEGERQVRSQGGRLMTWIGHVAVVRGTTENMKRLAIDDNVLRMEAEPCGKVQTDVSGQIVHTDEVHAGESLPRTFTGEGICCALLDHGLDFTHPAFLDGEGLLRVTYLYDAITDETFVGADVIAERQCSTTAERSYHGTHVMGIMGGSRYGPFCGMAPDATLLAADFDGYARNFEGGTSATVILAMKRLFDHADALGMPCVLNFSSSVGYLPGNPRTLEEECLEAMTGPGHIIVCAASNRGEKHCWLNKEEGLPHGGAMMDNVTSNYSGIVEWDLFTAGDITLTVGLLNRERTEEEQLLTINTDAILQADGQSFSTSVMRNTTRYTLTGNAVTQIDGQWLYHFTLTPSMGSLHSVCTLHLDGEADATIYLNASVSTFIDTPAPDGCADGKLGATIGWPAASPSVIAVGATAHTLTYTDLDGEAQDQTADAPEGEGKIALFSSRGPMPPGSPAKPDVCAPGVAIKAPYNHFYPMTDKVRHQLVWQSEEQDGSIYHYVVQSGTSMSSPMVAGVIALWLEAKPDLTTEEVRELLSWSCNHPDDTLPYPNDLYGHGEIDAHRGLLHLMGLDGIEEISLHPLRDNLLRIEGNQIILIPQDGVVTLGVRVYNTLGQMVLQHILSANAPVFDLSTLPHGIYVVSTGQGSCIVRI
ncbi:MAG: S8 family peptidase [Prevotella sp.]|nr:S8 family peptidase [Prevotella sp.]